MANAPPDEYEAAARSGAADAANASASASSSGAMRPPPWLGKQVGRFKLVSLLGKGAYGRVFLAQDVDLQRQVALKVITADAIAKRIKADAASEGESHRSLRSEGSMDAAVESLIREARAAARIEHPNVVQIYEVGRIHGKTAGGYIAMELLEGGTLQDLVKAAGPLDVARACAMVADAAEALQYGHDLGVVHRDVKPGNLMLSRIGRCKVADFGLACIDDPADSHRYLPIVGTAHYMAPEVIRGAPPDPRSDQYSLAATLYMILTGQPPYRGEHRKKVLEAHLEAPLPDLRKHRTDIDERLNEVIRRAMSKDPAQRFANIRQFGTALRLFTVSMGDASATSGSFAQLVQQGINQRAASDPSADADMSSISTSFGSRATPMMVAPGGRSRQKWAWIAGGGVIVLLIVAGLIFLFAGGDSDDTGGGAGTDNGTAPVTPPPVAGGTVVEDFQNSAGGYLGFPEGVDGEVTHVPGGGDAGHNGAARLQWNFTDLSISEAAHLIVNRQLQGQPGVISVRVRAAPGQPPPTVQLRAAFRDQTGHLHRVPVFEGELPTEWTTYTSPLRGTDGKAVDYPVKWEYVYIVRIAGGSGYSATGAIELDTLRIERSGG